MIRKETFLSAIAYPQAPFAEKKCAVFVESGEGSCSRKLLREKMKRSSGCTC
jgi:hypothetical protein